MTRNINDEIDIVYRKFPPNNCFNTNIDEFKKKDNIIKFNNYSLV